MDSANPIQSNRHVVMKSLIISYLSRRCPVGVLCGLFIIVVHVMALPAVCLGQGVSTLWSEGWEGDWVIDWHVDAGTWEVGTPTSGPSACHEGSNCAATVLGGNYAEGVDTRLIRHASFVVPCRLSF